MFFITLVTALCPLFLVYEVISLWLFYLTLGYVSATIFILHPQVIENHPSHHLYIGYVLKSELYICFYIYLRERCTCNSGLSLSLAYVNVYTSHFTWSRNLHRWGNTSSSGWHALTCPCLVSSLRHPTCTRVSTHFYRHGRSLCRTIRAPRYFFWNQRVSGVRIYNYMS